MENAFCNAELKNVYVIETLGFYPDIGFYRLAEHINRAQATCDRLGYNFDRAVVLMTLGDAVDTISMPARVRISIAKNGSIDIKSSDFVPVLKPWRASVADIRLFSGDPWLGVKTTKRAIYDSVRSSLLNTDEALFLNERDELCEGTITNIFIPDRKGRLRTPPLTSGCLPGVLRAALLSSRQAYEDVLYLDDLRAATKAYVGNSLRGLIEISVS